MSKEMLEEGGVGAVDRFELFGINNLPDVIPGMDLSKPIVNSMDQLGGFHDMDIIVVASKVISKSENMYQKLDGISPSEEAVRLSQITGKPATVCQLVINESQKVWTNGTALLALHKQGFELSSAGVDRLDENNVILLPRNSDKSAEGISQLIFSLTGKRVAVIISDSHGRADRMGAGAVALGVYGIDPLRITSTIQSSGKIKKADETLCDLLASAAAIIMGQRGRGIPVVCIRGISFSFNSHSSVKSILHNPPK